MKIGGAPGVASNRTSRPRLQQTRDATLAFFLASHTVPLLSPVKPVFIGNLPGFAYATKVQYLATAAPPKIAEDAASMAGNSPPRLPTASKRIDFMALLHGHGGDARMPVILPGALDGRVSAGVNGLFIGTMMRAVGHEVFTESIDVARAGTSTDVSARRNADFVDIVSSSSVFLPMIVV